MLDWVTYILTTLGRRRHRHRDLAATGITARAPALLLVAMIATSWLHAQEPSGPPPASSNKADRGPEVHELLPDLGRIGSQVGVRGGVSWNPYQVGQGLELGGYVRAARERLRKRFGLPFASPPRPRVGDPVDLAALRAAQERLVYAHAEGLPALGDRLGVDTMARNMVDLSRQLTVIDLWIEAEGNPG